MLNFQNDGCQSSYLQGKTWSSGLADPQVFRPEISVEEFALCACPNDHFLTIGINNSFVLESVSKFVPGHALISAPLLLVLRPCCLPAKINQTYGFHQVGLVHFQKVLSGQTRTESYINCLSGMYPVTPSVAGSLKRRQALFYGQLPELTDTHRGNLSVITIRLRGISARLT